MTRRPRLVTVLGEGAGSRPVGGTAIHKGQIERLHVGALYLEEEDEVAECRRIVDLIRINSIPLADYA